MNLSGTWKLTHRAETISEVEMVDKKVDPTGVPRWLAGNGRDLVGDLAPCSGLEIVINADGNFTERTTGPAAFDWFDVEGVLEPNALPFDGNLVVAGDAHNLVLAGKEGPIRYDDGDTTIADRFELDGSGRLLRSVSVVTDGFYLNRHLLVYERA